MMNSFNTYDVSDEELVRLAQQGSLEAFIALFDRFLPTVYRRVGYLVPEQDVASVIQEVFLSLTRSLKGYRGDSLFTNWLRALVRSQVVDYYRCQTPDGSMNGSGEKHVRVKGSLPGKSEISLDDCSVIRSALQQLPEKYTEILLLRLAERLRFYEIAQVQGQSLEATKSLFRRAVAALHKHLEEKYAKEDLQTID